MPAMGDMSNLSRDPEIDLEELRARLRRMDDAELIRFGKAGAFLCSPAAQPFGGKYPPRREFVIQLEAAREEWRRRKAQAKLNF